MVLKLGSMGLVVGPELAGSNGKLRLDFCIVQKRKGSVPIHFHINYTALNSI